MRELYVGVIVACGASASAATFTPIGPPGGAHDVAGISADGLTVVGQIELPVPEAFRWTAAEGIVPLGGLEGVPLNSNALAGSGDGSIIVGSQGGVTGLWSNMAIAFDGSEWSALGALDPPALFNAHSWAVDVSATGNVIVGNSTSANGPQAVRWVAGAIEGLGGLVEPDPNAQQMWSEARAMSADGSTVVGVARVTSPGNFEAFRWTEAEGMFGLGFPTGTIETQAECTSGDGRVVAGRALRATGGYVGFVWRAGLGMEELPEGATYPQSISDAGHVVVGNSGTGLGAFIWVDGEGVRTVQSVLENECGLELGGWVLTSAIDVSADGRTIIGGGVNPEGLVQSWIAVVDCGVIPPAPCVGDFDEDGDTDIFDFGTLSGNFGNVVPPGTLGDIDGDGDVDVFDFGTFAGDFGCIPQ